MFCSIPSLCKHHWHIPCARYKNQFPHLGYGRVTPSNRRWRCASDSHRRTLFCIRIETSLCKTLFAHTDVATSPSVTRIKFSFPWIQNYAGAFNISVAPVSFMTVCVLTEKRREIDWGHMSLFSLIDDHERSIRPNYMSGLKKHVHLLAMFNRVILRMKSPCCKIFSCAIPCITIYSLMLRVFPCRCWYKWRLNLVINGVKS